MTDFLITEMSLYPWFTWLVVFFAIAGIAYSAVWVHEIVWTVSTWLAYRRQVWLAKAAVRHQLRENPLLHCAVCKDRDALVLEALAAGNDPPEYEHPDGDDDLLPEPDESWIDELFPLEERRGGLYRDADGGFYGPEAEAAERAGPPVCEDPECDKYGWVHPPPCLMLPTMPVPKYLGGPADPAPAMPPQPVREYLHPAIMDDLDRAGFSEHETTDGAVDSIYTRTMAAEVQAMITDGVIAPE